MSLNPWVFSDSDDYDDDDDLDKLINSGCWSDTQSVTALSTDENGADVSKELGLEDDMGNSSLLEDLLNSSESSEMISKCQSDVQNDSNVSTEEEPAADAFGRINNKHRSAWKSRMQTFGKNYNVMTGLEVVSDLQEINTVDSVNNVDYLSDLWNGSQGTSDISVSPVDRCLDRGQQYDPSFTDSNECSIWNLQTNPNNLSNLTTLDLQSTICAALNSKCKLIWLIGVTDAGVVDGINLSRSDRDIFLQAFDYAISSEFVPSLNPSMAEIKFIKVNGAQQDLFVVELSVPKVVNTLYQLSSGRIYIRQNGVPTRVENLNMAGHILCRAEDSLQNLKNRESTTSSSVSKLGVPSKVQTHVVWGSSVLTAIWKSVAGRMSFAGFLDFARKDVDVSDSAPALLLKQLHAQFIYKYEQSKDSYEYVMAEPLRVSGIYWCVSAMDLLDKLDQMSREDIVAYVKDCQKEDGGFAPAPNHDSHLLHTLCAVQILIIFNALGDFDTERIYKYVVGLQNSDGSFGGDLSNEVDTRFTFVALATLFLIDRLASFDTSSAVNYVLSCYNFDGGFGTRPGSESHAGQVYCCVGTLCLTNQLDSIDRNKTAEWLAQRQCSSGGLNGRPEKLPDVCYSWWVLASLAMLKRLDWIDQESMVKFIYACQDDETGGFADRPGDYPDPFHTLFGIAGLSLLGAAELQAVDAVFCMAKKTLKDKSLC